MQDKGPSDRHFVIGDRIRVSFQGKTCDATIREVSSGRDGVKLKVDLGLNNMAVIEPWQVVKY